MPSLVRHLSGSFRALARIAGRRNAAAVVLTTKNKDHLYAVDSAEDDIKASGRQGKIKKKHAVAHWGETQLKPPNGYDKRENQHQDDEKFKKKSEKELALEKVSMGERMEQSQSDIFIDHDSQTHVTRIDPPPSPP